MKWTAITEKETQLWDFVLSYYGTGEFSTNENTIGVTNLLMAQGTYYKQKYGATHYKSKIEAFAVKHYLERTGGFISINDENAENPLTLNMSIGRMDCQLVSYPSKSFNKT